MKPGNRRQEKDASRPRRLVGGGGKTPRRKTKSADSATLATLARRKTWKEIDAEEQAAIAKAGGKHCAETPDAIWKRNRPKAKLFWDEKHPEVIAVLETTLKRDLNNRLKRFEKWARGYRNGESQERLKKLGVTGNRADIRKVFDDIDREIQGKRELEFRSHREDVQRIARALIVFCFPWKSFFKDFKFRTDTRGPWTDQVERLHGSVSSLDSALKGIQEPPDGLSRLSEEMTVAWCDANYPNIDVPFDLQADLATLDAHTRRVKEVLDSLWRVRKTIGRPRNDWHLAFARDAQRQVNVLRVRVTAFPEILDLMFQLVGLSGTDKHGNPETKLDHVLRQLKKLPKPELPPGSDFEVTGKD